MLAYALGEESFVDTNGTNLYFEASDPYQDLGEPFRNDRALTNRNANANWGPDANWTPSRPALSPDDGWTSGNAQRVSGEIFIDSNVSATWNSSGDGVYNGVLKPLPAPDNQVSHVRGALVQVLSTSNAAITALDTSTIALSHCVNGTPFVNNALSFRVAIRDSNPTLFVLNRANVEPLQLPLDLPGNILPAGTRIEFSVSNGKLLSDAVYIVPNTNEPSAGAWIYAVLAQSDATQSSALEIPPLLCTNAVSSGLLTVKVSTPMGVVTTRTYPVTD